MQMFTELKNIKIKGDIYTFYIISTAMYSERPQWISV